MNSRILRQACVCLALSFPLLLSACSLTPGYVQPNTHLPGTFAGQQDTQASLTAFSQENRDWWKNFQSQVLPRLQETALKNNHSFAAEGWVLSQSLSQARASRSSLFPSLDLNLSTSRNGSDSQDGYRVKDVISGTMQASYELDMWGKNSAGVNAQNYFAEAGLNVWRGAGLSLESEVALTYFSLLAARENLAVYDSMLQNAREVLTYQEKRETLGAAAPLDVTRQRNAVQSLEAERIGFQVKMNDAQNSLCQLLGLNVLPDDLEAAMAAERLMDIQPPAVDPGLPSELLARRPDIAEAEARLLAANANIGIARSTFLPGITLTASGGWQSDALKNLISPVNALYSLAGSLLQPIFNAGKLEAQYDEALAAKHELVERYQENTLTAFWEVSTSLTANSLLQTQEGHRAESSNLATEAYRIARTRYEQGAEDFLSVLDAQDSMLSADNSLVQTRLERLNSVVFLFKALGGGWGAVAAPVLQPSSALSAAL